MGRFHEVEDLVRIGAYRKGHDPETDRAIQLQPALERFLQQREDEASTLDQTRSGLANLFRAREGAPV